MLYYINTKNEQVTVIADHNNTTCIIHTDVTEQERQPQLKDAELYFTRFDDI